MRVPRGDLPVKIRAWVMASSAAFGGREEEAHELRVQRCITRPEAQIWFCELRWPGDPVVVCVKHFTGLARRDLGSLFRRATHLQSTMAEGTVTHARWLACDASLGVAVTEAVPGVPLEQRIVRAFFSGTKTLEQCIAFARQAARELAAMHKLSIPAGAPMQSTCSNREFVDRLRRTALDNAFVADCLHGSAFDPDRVIAALPPSFWERHEVRLLHGDFQAKNVLIDGAKHAALIDIDYGIGHPLRDVAQFLTQLERLYRRWRLPHARKILKACGASFCDQFAREGFSYLMEDLPFFRLWTIAFGLLPDQHAPAPVRRLIRHDLQPDHAGVIFTLDGRAWCTSTVAASGTAASSRARS